MVIRALEFYSGIGGLHLALKRSSVVATVVRAFDWDQTACRVYEANYGTDIAVKTDISTLTASNLIPLNASLWLMSPACQPYTVLNPGAAGAADPRAKSFIHLIVTVLPDMMAKQCAPTWLLVENVAGFETSTTRSLLVETLKRNGYRTVEFLLSPLQFGIPNSRLRYYLLAKYQTLKFASPCSYSTEKNENTTQNRLPGGSILSATCATDICTSQIREIRDFLDPASQSNEIVVPDHVLEKRGRLFDIVLPSSRRTCCFTRSYTRMVEGTGSIIQMSENLDTTATFDQFFEAQRNQIMGQHGDDPISILRPLKLRYFTPTELLRLFCFIPLSSSSNDPQDDYMWPASVTTKSQYKLIGNSVNVEVVKNLLDYLFEGDDAGTAETNNAEYSSKIRHRCKDT
ncbi:S-adenosyl-L-methionine-dependent methyltransferase [Rickenella mellea]|uniref:tRNA (cytosine(38)-C(5))-methyltransferase n=1 Tax=Rickenella mellea TaxID=50990 RepID=A0A4Y7PK34_9AGAM|nr:S-adenosyl-L-methionine-dependent methyltransferase [Rickenella mellea]